LNLPILTTNTSSAMELVENEKIGWVCDNDDLSIYKNLKRIIDKGLHLGLVEFYDVNNALELEQFKTLIGD
jgi:glycosyltransferase involved in cell wall biosynthesis